MKLLDGGNTSLRHVRKNVAFTGGAGLGAVGTVSLFTVTGTVWIALFTAECTEDLTEGGATATLAVGTAGVTAELLAQINAVDLDNAELWTDGTISGQILTIGAEDVDVLCNANIIATVGAQSISNGTINFDLFYRPVTDNGLVVAA